jgi:protein pelota
MKLLKKSISAKNSSGTVLLRPDTAEDLWHAYNLVQPTDLVRTTTARKVVQESSTGSTRSSKKRCMLTVAVEAVEFDSDTCVVRVSGRVAAENDVVRLGAHHTLTLELNQTVSVEKDCWDQIYLDRIEEACHPERQAEIAAVVLQPGLAHVCLVTGALTVTKARIDMTIPKKRTGSSQHDKATTKFLEAVYQAVLKHVDFQKVKCVLVGSPGFVKDDFYQYMLTESVRRDDRPLIENKSKFVLCKASSGHKHALEEVFSNATIMSQLTETKVAKEVLALNKFMRMMHDDPDRAYYGYEHVARAQEQLAIDTLLVTDELFRNQTVATRKQYVRLVERVRESGGTVYVFSSMHVSGQQLQQISGVAALLRYSMPDLDEMEEVAAVEPQTKEPEIRYDDPNRQLREDIAGLGL